jgi:hypothetical protein
MVAATLISCGSPRPLGAGGRIADDVYSSADGRVIAKVPPQLGTTEARIDEQRLPDGRVILAMANVFGATYTIVRMPLANADPSLRDLAGLRMRMLGVDGVTAAELANGPHGQELRISGVQKGASPITSTTNGVTRANDLAVAQRILVVGDERIEMGAGLSLLPGVHPEKALAEARQRLESFSTGLEFRAAPPQP